MSKICNINFWIGNDPPPRLELFQKFIRFGIAVLPLFGLPHPYPQEMIPSSVSLPLTLQQEELREAMQNVGTFIQKNHKNWPLTCKPLAHQNHLGNCPLLRPNNLQQGTKETTKLASVQFLTAPAQNMPLVSLSGP